MRAMPASCATAIRRSIRVPNISRRGCSHYVGTASRIGSAPGSAAQTCAAWAADGTTFIEVILNQELGEPFRRDAMKKPNVVAGISPEDMRPQ